MLKCLNMGSGRDYRKTEGDEEWTNLDINPDYKPDMVADIERPLPFMDDTFDKVLFRHVWEHCTDLFQPMEEAWRVCRPGGEVKVIAPYWAHMWSWGDPTHKHAISEGTFGFFSYPIYKQNAERGHAMTQLRPKCDFDVTLEMLPDNNVEVNPLRIRHNINMIAEIHATLTVVKPIRTFDLLAIMGRE